MKSDSHQQRPTFLHEKNLWTKHPILYGFDECGRGSIAGPLVVAGVCFSPSADEEKLQSLGIHDSKKLSAKKREQLEDAIKKECVDFTIQEISATQIDRIGIQQATIIAIEQSLTNKNVTHLLMDGNPLPCLKYSHTAIHQGDQKSISIAAASILGKVYRDRLMSELHQIENYHKYRWNKNKGYGSKEHYQAIERIGLSPYHRLSFNLAQTSIQW